MTASPPKLKRPVVFIGYMGAGKSTAASILASIAGSEGIDSDKVIERRAGMSITDIFETEGERKFREMEEDVITGLIEQGGKVIAVGGGAVTVERVREALKEALTVYLEVGADFAWHRVTAGDRPLARDYERFAQLLQERKHLYESLADVILPAEESGVVERAAETIAIMSSLEADIGIRVVWACAGSRDYPVYFGRSLLQRVSDLWDGRKAFVISDKQVAESYLTGLEQQLGPALAGREIIEPGEEQKTMENAQQLLRSMARAGVSRKDAVLALGGGVVGDIAGFCAATYQRGIDVIQIPTTLVAQVDSAYGGKTGVDIPEAKNYVGSFHQPAAVFVDPDLLDTLPQEELSAGFAEVVKTALIAGGPLWEKVVEGAPLEQLIFDGLRTKLDVVREDELELGRRAVLNLGHTVGHAIESASGYSSYRHGEAVALGLLAALDLSERKLNLNAGVRARVADLLEQHGLPAKVEGIGADEIVKGLSYDKKRSGGQSNWVLVKAPGEVLTNQRVEQRLVRQALKAIGCQGVKG